MVSPVPRQVGQGRAVMTWPRKDRCTVCTSPAPLQVSQVSVEVPGAVPAPVHTEQRMAVSTVISLRHPGRALGEAEPDLEQGVGPGLHPTGRTAATRSPAAAEEGVHDVAEAEALGTEAGAPPPLPPPPADSMGSPPRSTTWRLAGSESTS